jgi:hypothetical protein
MGGVGTQWFLSSAERDDPADRVIRGHADRHAISGNYLDAEAAHAAAQLREYLVARVALDAIQPAGVHRDNCSLHINEIVFAQQLILSSEASNECAT